MFWIISPAEATHGNAGDGKMLISRGEDVDALTCNDVRATAACSYEDVDALTCGNVRVPATNGDNDVNVGEVTLCRIEGVDALATSASEETAL